MPCDAPAAAPPRPTAQSSPLRVRCVVKLGGAACTVKAGVNELDGGALDAAARQLALGAAQFPPPSPVPFVVVHGAGSFGHPQVRGARLNHNSSDSGRAFYMATLDVLSTTNETPCVWPAGIGVDSVGDATWWYARRRHPLNLASRAPGARRPADGATALGGGARRVQGRRDRACVRARCQCKERRHTIRHLGAAPWQLPAHA